MGSTPREIRADSVGSRQAKYLHANLCFFDYLVISDLPQDLNKFDDCRCVHDRFFLLLSFLLLLVILGDRFVV